MLIAPAPVVTDASPVNDAAFDTPPAAPATVNAPPESDMGAFNLTAPLARKFRAPVLVFVMAALEVIDVVAWSVRLLALPHETGFVTVIEPPFTEPPRPDDVSTTTFEKSSANSSVVEFRFEGVVT